MTEIIMSIALVGLFGSIGVVYGITTKKLNKEEFNEHCKHDREDHKEMYQKLNDMSTKVTEIHTIVKQRER